MIYEYLIRNQIAKRNLTVAERIRFAEKSRPAIEKAARERQAEYHGNHYDKSRLPSTLGILSKLMLKISCVYHEGSQK